MKKAIIVISTLLLLLSLKTDSMAYTLSLGLDTRASMWESGMAELNAKIAKNKIKQYIDPIQASMPSYFTGYDLSLDTTMNTGIMFGPILGFETDNKKWGIDLSCMCVGYYFSELDAGLTIDYDTGFPLVNGSYETKFKTDIEIEEIEAEARVRRTFLDHLKIFVGYRYQHFETEINEKVDDGYGSISLSTKGKFAFTANVHMPYAGLGAYGDFKHNLFLHFNAGAGMAVAGDMEQKLEINGVDYSDDFKPEMAFMVFGDLTFGVVLVDHVRLSLGYQFRWFNIEVSGIDMDHDGRDDSSSKHDDFFHGISLKIEYLFRLKGKC